MCIYSFKNYKTNYNDYYKMCSIVKHTLYNIEFTDAKFYKV